MNRKISRSGMAIFGLAVCSSAYLLAQSGHAGSSSLALPPDYPRIQFVDVTEKAGIQFEHFHGVRTTQLPEDMGSGAAWGDYDNDGCPDLYVVDVAGPMTASAEEMTHSPGGNRLYRNNCNGSFTDVTAKAGLGFKGIGMAAAWADFDNDGYEDLIVTSYDRLVLYHNNGDGTFTDVTGKAGLEKYHGFWTGAAWGDYDRDGFVDLYVGGYVKYPAHQDVAKLNHLHNTLVPATLDPGAYPPERKLLFHNNGDGTFTEVSKEAGVDDLADRTLAVAWYDFDGDGWPDLYLANDLGGSKLFQNLHNGKFKDITRQAGTTDYRGAMGIGIGDWKNDGYPAIFLTHWMYQEDTLFDNLQAQTGTLCFADVADFVGIGRVTHSYVGFGAGFLDYDNDGRLDLMVVNGSMFEGDKDPRHLMPMKNLLFWQRNPTDGFYDVGEVSGEPFHEAYVGRGAAFADYNNHGYMDVFIVNQEGHPQLLRNNGANHNNWLEVAVKCTKSNRSGFGSKVEVETEGLKQRREIGGQTSYLSQDFRRAHFGLNQEKEAKRVTVVFPSGVVRTLEHVPANQILTVQE
jgi:enediyne biosynthesis protein E4